MRQQQSARIYIISKESEMRRHNALVILSAAVILGAGTFLIAQDSSPTAAEQQAWTEEQLDNLVAPIALYPDPLLGQVLAASTYPL
jgi:hypothetical protein